MLRWLWKMQSDRGGQHAEAGVLMATLVVLAGAVTVGSVPQLSTAVADSWTCHISDRDAARCDGTAADTSADEPTETRGRQLQATTYAASTTAGTPAEPALSHGPRQEENSGDGGNWFVKGQGSVKMDSCTSSVGGNCIDGQGLYYECTTTSSSGPFGVPLTQRSCSTTITSKTPLACTDEGTSPGFDTCFGPDGVVLHCSNPDDSGNRTCTDTDHDADAQIPGGVPVSCGEVNGDAATCLGSNGTLYQCPKVADSGQCPEGGRNINPNDPSLSDCVQIVSHGDTTGKVVRCTYTPASCNPAPADGSPCAEQAVSVRCLVDAVDSSNGVEYQHCQSLGEIVPAGSSLNTVCLVEEAGTCTTSASTALSPPAEQEDVSSTADLGPLDVELTDDYDTKLSIPTGETDADGKAVRQDMSHEELTTFCQGHAKQCDKVAAATQTETKNAYVKLLQHVGLCDDPAACQEVYAAMELAASGGPKTGRQLQALPLTRVQLSALGLFGAAGLTAYGSTYIENEKVKAGVQSVGAAMAFVGTILFGLDAYRGNVAGQAQEGVNTAVGDRLSALEAGQRATQTELAFAAQERINLMLENDELRGQLAGLRDQIDDPGLWRQFRALFGGE